MSLLSLSLSPNCSGHPSFTHNHKWNLARTTTASNLFSGKPTTRFSHHKKIQSSFSNINPTTTQLPIAAPPSLANLSSNTARMTMTPTTTDLELENMRNEGYWFREWDSRDITNGCWMVSMHVLGACAPFVFDWDAFWLSMFLTYLTGNGVTLGYHRLLSHRSFKVPKWLEYFFAYCGAHSLQRDPIYWASTHRHHHKTADTERDPHTPREGFWFSHIGWFLHNRYIATKSFESKVGEYSYADELKEQPFYRFLRDTYFWHPTALAVLLYLYGGFPYLAWGMGMRLVLVYNFSFLVGSVGHLLGERPYKTPDTSSNCWWVALLTLGEGWHNNHHAFPISARHGLEWWQFDMTWELINFLQVIGLATDVKVPTEDQKTAMAKLLASKSTN